MICPCSPALLFIVLVGYRIAQCARRIAVAGSAVQLPGAAILRPS
jgi:hypothetical protein